MNKKGPVERAKAMPAILGGIKKAQQDYEKMSGLWVWQGAEYWITSYVARALWKIYGDKSVVVEGDSNSTLDAAGRKRGRTPKIAKNKRYDIVLYFKHGKPRAVVEIKVQAASKMSIETDIKRVIAAVKKSKLRFGAVGYYWAEDSGSQKSANEKVIGYAKGLEERAKKIADKQGMNTTCKWYRTTKGGKSAWLAGCILVEEK